jgi:PTS system nitrogen regulatory IIA component
MAAEDFDIDRLAEYLHLDPAQVARLVERGKLPARRVSGSWRFSAAEIHHWLEEQMGLLSEDELQHMEGVLRGPRGGSAQESPSIAVLLPIDAIAIPLDARTRGSAITSMAELAARTGWLWDAGKLAEAVRAREDMQPTALDNGVALLHPRRPMPGILAQPFLAFGRTDTGIPFGGARGVLTDLFFLILSVDDRGHLQVLARLSRLLGDPLLLDALRHAASASEAHEAIAKCEQELT